MCLKYNLKKMCCFYVSFIHLVTMVLPYISKNLDEEKEIITILEQDLQEYVEKLLSSMNLNEEKKKKILKINWKANPTINLENNKNNKIIFIVGTSEFIKEKNQLLEQYHLSAEDTIIHCYEFEKEKENIKEILDTHHKILNTSGEKEISEVFIR